MAITLDPSRSAFVKAEYRYATSTDAPTLAIYQDARTIDIDSSLDETAATAIAAKTLAEWKVAKRNYEAVLYKTMMLEDFTSAPPAWTLTDARSNATNLSARTLNIKIQYKLGVSTITMRAS